MDEVNEKNWMTHPKIVEVQNYVKEVDRGISVRKYSIKKVPGEPERIGYFDRSGHVVAYFDTAGSEDCLRQRKHYYQVENGVIYLRFFFMHFGSADDTKFDHMIYFDKEHKRMWETRKVYSKGYRIGQFPDVLPDDLIIVNPYGFFEPLYM